MIFGFLERKVRQMVGKKKKNRPSKPAKRSKTVKRAKPAKKQKPAKKATAKKAPKMKIKAAKKPVKAAPVKKSIPPLKGKASQKSAKVELKKSGKKIAFLGLGSNVGDRDEFIEQAVFVLNKTEGVKVLKRSSNQETEAEGVEDQPAFLNAALMIETTLSAQKLLEVTQQIEATLGREREVEWGPRTIDIDILLYDNDIVSEDKLQIPHPLLHERLFVLKPLMEIAPDAVHPTLEKTISDIYEEKKLEVTERYDDELPGFKEIKQGAPDDFERW